MTETNPNKWLIAYNSISASLWSIVLFNVLFLTVLVGQPEIYEKTNVLLTVVQLLAVTEIINIIIGVVKTPLFTTVMQVFSRLLIVLGVCQLMPGSPANYHWCYISLTLSWSITEVIRYSYYASNLVNPSNVPYWLTWARYSLFVVLYPSGVASEVMMLYFSLDESKQFGSWCPYFLWVVIATYPPGLFTLYTHMLKQRKKVLGKMGSASHHKLKKKD